MSSERKIWVNARFLTQSLTGMQRLAYNLVKRLPEARLITPGPPKEIYSEIDADRIYQRPHPFPSHLWEQCVLPGAVPAGDTLWSPTGIGPLRCADHVLTIPDLSFMDLPECFSRTFRAVYKTLYPISARRARRIITISEYTRERIQIKMGVPAEHIVVIYPAVDERFCPQDPDQVRMALEPHGLRPQGYLLALGAISPRKNFGRLLQAWQHIASRYDDIELVVVGERGLSFSGGDSLGTLPPRTRHLTGVDDTLLIQLYSGALAFAFPSLYEGFGLPVLEAMACGTPVLTSTTTSLPEVAGAAALLVDPYSLAEIKHGLCRLLESENLRAQLIQAGRQQARKFNWDRAACQTLQAICDHSG